MPPLLDSVEARCSQYGEDLLVVDGQRALTGAAFLELAHDLCADLQDLGVRPGSRVGLQLPPSDDLLIAIVATWLAGAAFVPLDPDEAPDRRVQILADSGAGLVLARHAEPAQNPTTGVAHATMSGGRVVSAPGNIEPSTARSQRPDEAYVIFTSGSTGRPKGVSVGHDAIAAYVREACRVFELPAIGGAFPVQLPPTFDAALTSLLLPLVTRHVAVPLRDPVSPTRELATYLKRSKAAVLVKTTPSQLRLLRDFLTSQDVDRLNGVFVVGGEPLDYADLTWLRRADRVAIFNEYGPTEATVGCSVHRVAADDPTSGPVPIGTPHQGVRFFIDDDGRDDGSTATGELIIAGPIVANGYINAPANNSFGHRDGLPSYRTGDRVRRDEQGRYHFLGRHDDQVKIQGFRVELGEVEAALRAAATGRRAAALVTREHIIGVLDGPSDLDVEAVTTNLRRRLPAFMLPGSIQVVPTIPLTAHGKIDRRRLATDLAIPVTGLADPPPQPAATAPGDHLDETIADLWRTLLGLDTAAAGTDFFALGDSITALKLAGRLKQLGYDVPVSLVFDHPTLASFTVAARSHLSDQEADAAARDTAAQERTPAPAQLAILEAELLSPPDQALFTVVDAVRVTGVPDWPRLPAAIAATLARHEVLGWRFSRDDARGLVAEVGEPGRPLAEAVDEVDLRALPEAAAEAAIAQRLAQERDHRIDLLSGARGVRALVFRTRPDATGMQAGVCALVAHHALVDETSMRLLWTDVFTRVDGDPVDDGHGAHYAQWATQMATAAAGLRATRSAAELASRLTESPLGTLVRPDPQQPAMAASGPPLRFTIPAELAGRAIDAARRFAVPVSAIYGAAVVRALGATISRSRFALFMPMTLRRAGTVHWSALSPPAGPAKHDLSIFITPGARHRAGAGRLLWRTGPADRALVGLLAPALASGVLDALNDLCGRDELPPAGPLAGERADQLWPAGHAEAPSEPDEAGLAQVVTAIAGTLLAQPLAADDSLFEAGARSLDLIRLTAEIGRTYGVQLSAVDVFDHPTPAELASLILTRGDPARLNGASK